MLDILLFILFSVQNSKLAKAKGLNSTSWVLRTIAAMFGGIFIGSLFVYSTYRGPVDVMSVQKFIFQNPLKLITFYALEIGGGLLVRFLLERKPDITNQA